MNRDSKLSEVIKFWSFYSFSSKMMKKLLCFSQTPGTIMEVLERRIKFYLSQTSKQKMGENRRNALLIQMVFQKSTSQYFVSGRVTLTDLHLYACILHCHVYMFCFDLYPISDILHFTVTKWGSGTIPYFGSLWERPWERSLLSFKFFNRLTWLIPEVTQSRPS